MVRIRLQRLGRTHRPFYRINAIDQRTRRNGQVIENLGWFNPMEKDEAKQVHLKEDRIKAWLDKGAQPSDTVRDMLARADLLSPKAKAQWEAQREIDRKRGGCKAAVKAIEGIVEELEKLAEDADGDITQHVNTAKRSLNDAKNTVANAILERAEALQQTATEALDAAKSAAAAAAEAEASTEEAPEGEGAEAPAEEAAES
ncbi:MAG: 30S ribosomal protein S16 [Planctomycetota bacterium]